MEAGLSSTFVSQLEFQVPSTAACVNSEYSTPTGSSVAQESRKNLLGEQESTRCRTLGAPMPIPTLVQIQDPPSGTMALAVGLWGQHAQFTKPHPTIAWV